MLKVSYQGVDSIGGNGSIWYDLAAVLVHSVHRTHLYWYRWTYSLACETIINRCLSQVCKTTDGSSQNEA